MDFCYISAPKNFNIGAQLQCNGTILVLKITLLTKYRTSDLACERESEVQNLMPNLIIVAFKVWAYSPQNCQNW